MIQPIVDQPRARVPLAAIAALAIFGLGALAGASLPRAATLAAPEPIVMTQAPASRASQPPTVVAVSTSAAETGSCAAGAYVTGDMVGDANPATVYATMCGTR
jgi:hypothetical protein